MDRSLQKKIIFVLSLCFSLLNPVKSFAQEPSQLDQIRIQIWADMDAFPGHFEEEVLSPEEEKEALNLEEDELEIFRFSINRAKQIAPYLLSGMLGGWGFEYTPSDKARKVEEYFELTVLKPFDTAVNRISYKSPQVDGPKLKVWAFCDRTATQKIVYQRWISITHPKIKGIGEASVEKGFEGIQEACENAVKNGVREYWRIYEKNKPKEISGSILIVDNPRIYIRQGKYVVDLDFFMETDRIIRYSLY